MFKSVVTSSERPSVRPGNSAFPAPAFRSEGDVTARTYPQPYITILRRTDDINNIESEGRYCDVVMPRRTDDINSIESEGRYPGRVTPRRHEDIDCIESERREDCEHGGHMERVTAFGVGCDTENTGGHSVMLCPPFVLYLSVLFTT